jgi:hypothetical protein
MNWITSDKSEAGLRQLKKLDVQSEVLRAVPVNIVFGDVAPCGRVEICQCVGESLSYPENEVGMSLRNVGVFLTDNT